MRARGACLKCKQVRLVTVKFPLDSGTPLLSGVCDACSTDRPPAPVAEQEKPRG